MEDLRFWGLLDQASQWEESNDEYLSNDGSALLFIPYSFLKRRRDLDLILHIKANVHSWSLCHRQNNKMISPDPLETHLLTFASRVLLCDTDALL